ncbi:hypothetical protein [Sediminibacillus terrae]|uniref:hypothetical protein n=1 Tax=Sediminibacillus terrae TaxID=1562106 RepID=UPI001294FDB4|nr:hypothetical protein [Sediminibacillus terrae]
MIENQKFINLYGRSVGILKKDKYKMLILFSDKTYGKVVCIVPSESILYYTFDKEKSYHLQVDLKGATRMHPDGSTYTKNNLVVKRAKVIR